MRPAVSAASRYFYSDQGNDLDNTMTREVDGGGPLTAVVNYEIEQDWDYAFLESSSDDGETWDKLETNLSDKVSDHEDPADHDASGFNGSDTGMTGTTDGWIDLTATVPDDATHIRFRYMTDGAAVESGLPGRQHRHRRHRRSAPPRPNEGWVFDGFRTTTGSDVSEHTNAYFVDNRQYVGGDKTLEPPLQLRGLREAAELGRLLQVLAGCADHLLGQLVLRQQRRRPPRSRRAAAGRRHTRSSTTRPTVRCSGRGSPRTTRRSGSPGPSGSTLHHGGERYTLRRHAGQPLFDDTMDWWFDSDEHASSTEAHPGHYQPGWYSVDVPKTGTTIKVVKVNKAGVMTVRVGSSS